MELKLSKFGTCISFFNYILHTKTYLQIVVIIIYITVVDVQESFITVKTLSLCTEAWYCELWYSNRKKMQKMMRNSCFILQLTFSCNHYSAIKLINYEVFWIMLLSKPQSVQVSAYFDKSTSHF
jgi:hypothetical protein